MRTWPLLIVTAAALAACGASEPQPTAHDIAADLAARIDATTEISNLDPADEDYGHYLAGDVSPTSAVVLALPLERCTIGVDQCAAIVIVEDRDPDEVAAHVATWDELADALGDTRTYFAFRESSWLVLDEVRSNDAEMSRLLLASTFGGERA